MLILGFGRGLEGEVYVRRGEEVFRTRSCTTSEFSSSSAMSSAECELESGDGVLEDRPMRRRNRRHYMTLGT